MKRDNETKFIVLILVARSEERLNFRKIKRAPADKYGLLSHFICIAIFGAICLKRCEKFGAKRSNYHHFIGRIFGWRFDFVAYFV